MSAPDPKQTFWVVIPAYNEARGIEPTLAALRRQDDRDFAVVVVDNASTDGTRDAVVDFAKRHPSMRIECIDEPEKGTGCAADTGFRHAIASGAEFVARTDADCVPRRDWVTRIKEAFADGTDFIAGYIGHRRDDLPVGVLEHAGMVLVTEIMEAVTPRLAHHKGPEFLAPAVLAGGGNLATRASIYLASGGFPRISIEHENDDRVLLGRIRKLTPRIVKDRRVVVLQSTRRVKSFGFRNTVLWYWNRKYKPEIVDIR